MVDAERKGYARGYAAGRKKVRVERSREQERLARQAFWDKAFLAAIPAVILMNGWTRGDAKISLLGDRIRLATEAADEALAKRRQVR